MLRAEFKKKTLWLAPTILFLLPLFTNNGYVIFVITATLFYSMVALSLNIVVGLSGIWQLAHAVFLAVGAYTAGFLAKNYGLSLWIGIPLGALVAAGLSLVLSLPTVRLRDEYLMIATLNFGVIAQILLTNLDGFTGGTAGMSGIPSLTIPWLTADGLVLTGAVRPDQQYFIVLLGFFFTFAFAWRVQCSPMGRALRAMREDELVTQSMGQDTRTLRVIAFAIGCGLAGLAGGIFAARFHSISPASANLSNSVLFLAMVIVGGVGNIWGVIIGAVLLSVIPEIFRDLERFRLFAFGMILVTCMVFRPQGLFPERLQTFVAGRQIN